MMNWIIIGEIVYSLLMVFVILRVLLDTRSSTKALAYILFIIFVPFIGIIFYFTVGVNYRKRKLYSKKIVEDEPFRKSIKERMNIYSESIRNSGLVAPEYQNLSEFILRSGFSPLTANNKVKLLVNGEEKFPELLHALENATSHIHLEYYIYEEDVTGNAVADVLIKKAQKGVEVRFMYDDFGSRLSRTFIKRLEDGGVQTIPFYRIIWYAFANRLNYRNHRKIIIIDGTLSFIGGINMSDRYRNDLQQENKLFWRDTHLMIEGPSTGYLQYLFLCDWNFCSPNRLVYGETYFPTPTDFKTIENDIVQIAASGPDSTQPIIFYSILQAIASAKKNIYITSPYFIPGDSLMDVLIIAIQSGLDVKIIIPGASDTKMVDAAARAYYTVLLKFGAKIYQYHKGFIHAKTLVIDDNLAIVGSANMDYRSFDLNFEVNAMIYSTTIAKQLTEIFEQDLKASELIDAEQWLSRPKYMKLWERTVRLLSPFL